MAEQTEQGPIVYLKPVAAKRYTVLAMLYLLAGVLAWLAVFQTPQSTIWLVLLWALTLSVLLLANSAGKATAEGLQLRDSGIYTDAGELLVRIDDIRKIHRGVFAVKPSNGFLLRLKSRHKKGWAPGLWWRFGAIMGIGGVTSKIQAEVMAEAIAALVERKGVA